jgi:dienelactone hydrolase
VFRFGLLRSWRLVAGAILLGVLGAVVAFGPSPGARSSGATSTRSPAPPSSVEHPPPKSFNPALRRTGARRSGDRIEGPYGRSDREVWVVRPDRPVRSVVVFGHGWKLTPPSPAHSWVGQFRPWLDHLAAGGSAVIFPRYQLGAGDAQDATRMLDFEAGVRAGYALLGRPRVPVVAVGYSFGASLAFYYSANAASWRLPLPSAVQAVFPGGMIPGAPLPRLNRSVRVLIQVGDADIEAGSAGADAFWSWLATHPSSHKRYQVVRSSPPLAATHAAPKSLSPAAQGTFWAPLDRLIAQARSTPAATTARR